MGHDQLGQVEATESDLKQQLPPIIYEWVEDCPNADIVVPQAVNPYQEAYSAAGIADVVPRREIKLNLVDRLRFQQGVWRDKGLPSWADALGGVESFLRSISAITKQVITQEINDGSIIIVMPGKDIQRQTTLAQFTEQMKPRFVDPQKGAATAGNAVFSSGYFQKLIDNQAESLVEDIPMLPYILLTKPTKIPWYPGLDRDKTNCLVDKTVQQQKDELVKINQERAKWHKPSMFALNVHEYFALQNIWPEELSAMARADNINLKHLTPLDMDVFTRFISVPPTDTTDLGKGLQGAWFGRGCYLNFMEFYNTNSSRVGGIRLSVRIVIG